MKMLFEDKLKSVYQDFLETIKVFIFLLYSLKNNKGQLKNCIHLHRR